jgi:hypothetical protein
VRTFSGYVLLAVGLAFLVLPGPGFPFLLGGLALLARDRPWARRGLDWAKRQVVKLRRARRPRRPRGALPGAAAVAIALTLPAGARASAPWVDFEAGAVASGYNDVRIPGDSGTRFSLSEDLSTRSAPYFRIRAGIAAGRHEVHALYAPLRLEASGTAPDDIDFFGTTFPAGAPLRGTYRFDSYRLGYRYALVQRETLELAVGLTAKIRDAAITVCSATCTVRANTGFVPLASVRLHWRFAGPVGLLLDAEGLAGGPGRAEDVTVAVTWDAAPNVTARAGARIVEGGADTDSVYNFALLAYAGAGLTVRL